MDGAVASQIDTSMAWATADDFGRHGREAGRTPAPGAFQDGFRCGERRKSEVHGFQGIQKFTAQPGKQSAKLATMKPTANSTWATDFSW